MKPQAIFIDIDRTLCSLKNLHTVSKINLEALHKAQKDGIHVVLSTGRDNKDAWKVFEQVHFNDNGKYLIHSNGSVLEDASKEHKFFEKTLDVETAKKIVEFGKKYNFAIKFPLDSAFYCGRVNFWIWLAKKIYHKEIKKYEQIDVESFSLRKIGFFTAKSKKDTKLISEQVMKEFPNIEVTRTGSGFYMETTNKGVSKANAAKHLAHMQNWDLSQCVAIGDSINDLELMKMVGYPVAMKNSLPELFELQKTHENFFITDTDSKNGVAKALEKINNI